MNNINSFSWLRKIALRAMVIGAIAVGTVSSAQQNPLGNPGTCGTEPGQLNCFDPYAAGEMWRSLDTILARTQPDVIDGTDPAVPEHATQLFDGGEPIYNEFGEEVWVTTTTSLSTAISQIGPGECTFSHLGDPINATRVCKDDAGTLVPPPIGNVFYPSGVAVFKHRVYVSDRMNHRVQVVNFFGDPLSDGVSTFKPIGNGEPGTGTYSLAYPGHPVGWRLKAPNGLAVDASNRLLVADGGNNRIAIFNGDTGDIAFSTQALSFRTVSNSPFSFISSDPQVPTYVAVSPNASLQTPGTAPLTGHTDERIVVIDRWKCTVTAYDIGFTKVWTYPSTKPTGSATGTACVDPSVNNATGVFSLMTGVTIDAQNRIYIVDSYNNRIQVFSKDGVPLGTFGAPSDPDNPGVETLFTPSSIVRDHNGRIVVNDSDHLRLAFYDVTFPTSAPVAKFLFETPAAGDDIEEFPTGLAEQWGTTADGADEYGNLLDPAGRYVKVDTAGNRLQRLELADLAIVQASAKNGEGYFNVAVPSEKANPVFATHANVVPGELDEEGNLVNVPANVTVTSVVDISPGTVAADDIYPGQWVKYKFTYVDNNPTPLPEIPFVITAVGNEASPQSTEAPPVVVRVRAPCVGCDADLTVYKVSNNAVASTVPTVTGNWYPEKVYARLTPSGVNASRVKFIEWKVTGTDLIYHGNGVHQTFLQPGARYVDVVFQGKGSDITYWAVADDNTIGPEHTKNLKVDFHEPTLSFSFDTAPSGYDPLRSLTWWRTDVLGTYAVTDDESGTDDAGGPFTVTGEGLDRYVEKTGVDRVGHVATYRSNNGEHGGQVVNIDRTAPVVIPPDDLVLIAPVGGGAATVPTSFINGATATDALSGLASPVTAVGPATVAAGSTVTWMFQATDYAGNVGTASAKVTAATSALRYTGERVVEYGHNLPVSAVLDPAAATGQIQFTLIDPSGRGSNTVSGTLAGGVATATMNRVVANIGTYTLRVEYVGTDVTPAPSVNVTITVNPTPFNFIAAPNQQKYYGAADPDPFAYHASGELYHSADVITGKQTRVAGETPGLYDILQGTLAINSNYKIFYTSAKFTILASPVTVRANDLTLVYGQVSPTGLAGATVSGSVGTTPVNYTLSTTRTTFSNVGSYAITVVPGTNPNYLVTVVPGTLTVIPRKVTVQAENKVKLVNTADPVFTYHDVDDPNDPNDGRVNGATYTGVLSRVAGEALGNYEINNNGTTNRLTLGSNYTLTVLPGTLSIVSILPGNHPPVAGNDSATTVVGTPVSISVLSNDSDPDGDALTVTTVTQPTNGEGTVTIQGSLVRFMPAANFVGLATFTYTISDGKGGYATATVTVMVTAGVCTTNGFTTYTQGGWGSKPSGSNPGALLAANFASLYPSGIRVGIVGGTGKALTFTSAKAISNFLPGGGTAGVLKASATDPKKGSANVLAGQVLALQLNVDFSRAGIKKAGLGELMYNGRTVSEILALGHQVLGGNTAALAPYGWTIAQLNNVIDSFNRNFDNGTQNLGALSCPR